jgi:transcriptional regulator with XRE-family HTH domain
MHSGQTSYGEAEPAGERHHPGARIRAARRQQRLSLRELARRAELTPSHVSKIERGVTNPSVGALWRIADVLGMTVAQLFANASPARLRGEGRIGLHPRAEQAGKKSPSSGTEEEGPHGEDSPVVELAEREILRMAGVEFQRLTPLDDDSVEFIEVRHEVGAGDTQAYHHRGREYGVVISGRLLVEVGGREYLLGPGASIAFDSTIPHRIVNACNETTRAIWLTMGRNPGKNSTQGPESGGSEDRKA